MYIKDAVTLGPKEKYGINGASRHAWIKLTQVFRLWRDIAICAPNLWSGIRISKRNYKWANAMLQRSQHTFLNVHVNFVGFTRRTRGKYKDIDTALSILEANLGRCKALSLYNVRSAGFGEFFPPPNHYAPQLHTFRIFVAI